MQDLTIVYRDEHLIAINKPHGLLVHRSSIARDVEEFALQKLRDQIGETVYLTHRLDRKTGGVLLFALNEKCNVLMQKQFANHEIDKNYWAIVRGYTPDEDTIDYPLKKENGRYQDAVTHFVTLQKTALNIVLGKHATSRYSWVSVTPKTGRMHQIRKHFAHIFHPIIGDRPHGCNKQNKFFKDNWGMDTMLLHARKITFKHPIDAKVVEITAPLHPVFLDTMIQMGFDQDKGI